MNMHRFNFAIPGALVLGLLFPAPSLAQDLVTDDLITGSNLTTPWQVCDTDSTGIDVTSLDAGLCAYRTTPVSSGVTYKMSCGVTVAKYASITLAFLDADDTTLATKTTEVTEHVSGAYSVELTAPAGTVTGAIGIYGEPGSGFQDCVLIDATPPEEPTKGSISGITWFDKNDNQIFGGNEKAIAGSLATLYVGNTVLKQSRTDAKGSYNFGNLDIGACYTVGFAAADQTLELGAPAGDNDAVLDGKTVEICLTEDNPDVTDVDAAFVTVPPVLPPADYAICGSAWLDSNENGVADGTDSLLPGITVKLFKNTSGVIKTTTTDSRGRYAFDSLGDGLYQLKFETPDGHETTTTSSQPLPGSSYVNVNGNTVRFNLPADKNTGANSACTVEQYNAGYIKTPVALDPTVAKNDKATHDVGVDFTVDILANDAGCDGVHAVDLLGSNVPGKVRFGATIQQLVISGTTAPGKYTVKYGLRGACGSYDTAEVTITLLEVIPPAPPAAPDAPICRVETRGDVLWGGADVFNNTENGFAPNYNLYDRNKDLVITLDSSDTTHKKVIPGDVNHWSVPYIGKWEIEWNGANYGYDQVSIYYISAVENGVESELTECARHLISPIAIDLDNNGHVERITGDYSVDLDSDGIEETLTQWFAPSAGILVTGDVSGKITGKSLFGNVPGVYEDGFAELATLDLNNDGQLTDSELSALSIWTDLNSDTIVDEGELSTLEDHNIVALAVNHYKYMARATKADSSSVLMEDVWFPASYQTALLK